MSTPVPQVDVHIEGLILLFFQRSGSTITGADFGVLDYAPGHEFTVKVKKNGAEIPAGTLNHDLRLVVHGPAKTGIILHRPDEQIHRINGTGDQASIRWLLDFEGSELFDQPIGVDPTQFRSVFHVNDGLLFTKHLSNNHLLTCPALIPSSPWKLVGKVATAIGIRIPLDQEGSVVEFFNGATQVARAERGENLELTIKLSHPEDEEEGTPHYADANMYYSAVGSNIAPLNLRLFSSTNITPGVPAAPEASCLVGHLKTTTIS